MDAAYDIWRDDLAFLSEEAFAKKYGQGKEAMWQKVQRDSQQYIERLRASLPPNPETVAHA